MMKTWSYGINSHPDHMLGSIVVYERPWWIAAVEWFALSVDAEWLYKLKLPRWPVICWDESEPEECTCSPREWYGSVGGMVNGHITNPLIGWVYRHPKNRQKRIELGYARVRELFYLEAPEWFDEELSRNEEES